MSEDAGLAFGGRGTVAAHGGEDEGGESAGFEKIHDGADDGGDIGDPAAADSDRDSRARSEIRGKRRELADHSSRDVFEAAIREVLADGEHPGKGHILRILKSRSQDVRSQESGVSGSTGFLLLPRFSVRAETQKPQRAAENAF